MYFGFYTCIIELIHVFQILHVYFGTYTGLTELILEFRITYWFFGSYSFAKVPVGTISRNRSGSYHIQGQITYSLYGSNRSYD